jgi:hypothetical protein
MKKLIPLFVLATMCISGCAGNIQVSNPDTFKSAVIASDDSITAKNAINGLKESVVSTLTADRLNSAQNLEDYDVIYIDKSVAQLEGFDAKAVQERVSNGACVFLDNEVYDLFDRDFIGAEDFVPVDVCPVEMTYPDIQTDGVKKIQVLLRDFVRMYTRYSNYDVLAQQSYGVGVIPSTAECVAEQSGTGIYTINQYGDGLVFFTSPLLPNAFSVNNLSPQDNGEYLSATTVGANKLIRDYFAEMASLKKYGYAIETVFGSFARPAAAWELHYEDITGIENGSAEIFEEMCKRYGQVPSFTLARNPYVWFRRAESVTYALNDNGQFAMDPYENAYSSGTHFVSAKKWLSLDYYDNTISYFEQNRDYIKRAYPCPTDFNGDGNMDLICGSADGKLYYFEGSGMQDNYELGIATMFTDTDGNQISVGAYSSPDIADLDNDGINEIITGDENGSIHCFKPVGGMVLEDLGIILETGMTDAMPALGDLNNDGITDMAVGSRNGEMRIYYGEAVNYGTAFTSYETVETGQTWCAPCIADVNGDGINELYSGTFEGYIAGYENGQFLGYLEGNECNYEGNIHLKFGSNSVPRFYDINRDGQPDLIAGSLEYGMAVPIDSKYFPYRDRLQEQLNGFRDRGIYVGVHALSHEHADPAHDARELEYQKKAFESYGLDFVGSGANQHTWRTSKVGYDTHYDNMTGYDGTYRAQMDAGLYWNSGSQTPNSTAVPEVSSENSILVPFYLNNGQLMLQPCNTPNGYDEYSDITANYELPLLFYNHCDYVYREQENEDKKIKEADALVNAYGYNFVQENQLAKMTAAALNTIVDAKWDNDALYLQARAKSTKLPLYDKDYQNSVGVKIIFANGVSADEFNVNASVSYKKDNCIYASLDKGAVISKKGENTDFSLTAVNLPADISGTKDGATVKFLDGGMMTATVNGMAKTPSGGWEVTQQNGKTIFRKYGKKSTLKIIK